MRFIVTALSVFFIGLTSMSVQAQQSKDDLFTQCNKYKDEAFCSCAMGKPYANLVALNAVSPKTSQLERHLNKLEGQYKISLEREMSQGGLSASQIERICNVVDEYNMFLEELGMPYKNTGVKSFSKKHKGGAAGLTSEQRQALTLKRTELNKKIHDLNHEYQRNGAFGSSATLTNGVCAIEHQIEWTKEAIDDSKKEETAPVAVGVRPLIAKAMQMCGG